jgi:hypothetical protein
MYTQAAQKTRQNGAELGVGVLARFREGRNFQINAGRIRPRVLNRARRPEYHKEYKNAASELLRRQCPCPARARWQVLGAIALFTGPRACCAARQGVQRIVNELAKEGLVEFRANPHHRRASLVVLTARAKFTNRPSSLRPWVNALSNGIAADDIARATCTLRRLRQRLEGRGELDEDA